MKNFFSKFLIVILILGFFLAPATPKLDTQNHFSLVKNEAKAEVWWYKSQNILLGFGDLIQQFPTKDACEQSIKNAYGVSVHCNNNPIPDEDKGTTALNTDDQGNVSYSDNDPSDYGCGFNPLTWHKCIVLWTYWLIFLPLAKLARLAASLLDYFAFYSLTNTSYENDFVDIGWATIRDLANLFFIIALLYVAGKTVLGLNASNNKKAITMVIVIALLINFSLFISKIVIDASNILARVFYSSIESVDKNGQPVDPGFGEGKSITVGLVKQFNPQNIFHENGGDIEENIGVYAVLLIVSIIMMCYMIYVFLSISFVFIGRVVMLWILMIFSPIAFVSLTLPGVKIPSFSFREWWEQLSNQAFLAPIFIFFLYLIISFGKFFEIFPKSVGDTASALNVNPGAVNDLESYLQVLVPFLILMKLLSVAKSMTVKMAGEIGSGMSKLGTLLGGAALGLSAAGIALAGRQTVGATAKYAQNENARNKDSQFRNRIADQFNKGGLASLNILSYAKIAGKSLAAKTAIGVRSIPALSVDKKTGKRLNVGESIDKSQIAGKDFNHAKHALDGATQEVTHDKTATYSSLLETEQVKIREKVNRDELALEAFGVKFEKITDDTEKVKIKKAVETYTKKGETGKLSFTDNKGNNHELHHSAKDMATSLNNKSTKESVAVNEFVNALRKGSYDIRGLADSKFNNNKGMLGGGVFLAATVATGLRMGLKNIGKVDPGKPQKDFLKDLNLTIGGAIKQSMSSFKLDSVGGGGGHGGGGHDDHGGGHDDHGGGHGH